MLVMSLMNIDYALSAVSQTVLEAWSLDQTM